MSTVFTNINAYSPTKVFQKRENKIIIIQIQISLYKNSDNIQSDCCIIFYDLFISFRNLNNYSGLYHFQSNILFFNEYAKYTV